MISVSEAWELVVRETQPLAGIEQLPPESAIGRLLAAPVLASEDAPRFRKSLMDGFALRAAEAGPEAWLPVRGTILAGPHVALALEPGTAVRIMTGAEIPPGADAVVPVEQARTERRGETEFVLSTGGRIAAGQNILERGANLRAGMAALPAAHRLRPVDLGLISECGATSMTVCREPTLALLVTGDELVDRETSPGPGQIRNSNGPLLAAMMSSAGLSVTNLGMVGDEPDLLRSRLSAGLAHDVLVVTGGVSAGLADHVPRVLRELGVEEVFHKVAVKPGRPVWFGVRRDGSAPCHVFGLPGNPLGSLAGFELFVRLAARRLGGSGLTSPPEFRGRLTKEQAVRGPRTTWWPGWVSFGAGDAVIELTPTPWNGSSDLASLGRSNCLIELPPRDQPWQAGESARWLPLGPMTAAGW